MVEVSVLRVNAPVIARALGVIALLLFLVSLANDFALHASEVHARQPAKWLLRINYWFNLDREDNFPSYFSMLLLLASAAILGVVALLKRKMRSGFTIHWVLLSLIFHLMAFDEIMQLHERLVDPLRKLLGASDYLYYAWVVPGMAAVILFSLLFARFLLDLPSRFRRLFMTSGSIYLTGVLGVELLEGHWITLYGSAHQTLPMIVSYSIQELLEMEGIVLFIYTLLEYLRWFAPDVRIELDRI